MHLGAASLYSAKTGHAQYTLQELGSLILDLTQRGQKLSRTTVLDILPGSSFYG
jgi:hypothetical protein